MNLSFIMGDVGSKTICEADSVDLVYLVHRVYLVDLVCLVDLVSLVYFVWSVRSVMNKGTTVNIKITYVSSVRQTDGG